MARKPGAQPMSLRKLKMTQRIQAMQEKERSKSEKTKQSGLPKSTQLPAILTKGLNMFDSIMKEKDV